MRVPMRHKLLRICAGILVVAWFCFPVVAQNVAENNGPVRGLWVWKGPSVVADAASVKKLRDFCQSENINEVYISVSSHGVMLQGDFPALIDALHRAGVHVEALLSSADADEAGTHREKLLDEVRRIIRFNDEHPKRRFDGIHLDIEPQQRPENKGEGNLRFLSGLVDAYNAVRELAKPARLTVNADIQNKLLKGDVSQRRMLLSSLPQLTLMLYEVSSPRDGADAQQKAAKIQAASRRFLEMAYDGLDGNHLAKLVIGLRTPDYGPLLPKMLEAVETANSTNPYYGGWARHSYNEAEKE